jgi:hypothetical protein
MTDRHFYCLGVLHGRFIGLVRQFKPILQIFESVSNRHFCYLRCVSEVNLSFLFTSLYTRSIEDGCCKEMSIFGKKLADQGIYNMRHQDHGDRDRYYDGIRLLTDMRGVNQTTID